MVSARKEAGADMEKMTNLRFLEEKKKKKEVIARMKRVKELRITLTLR